MESDEKIRVAYYHLKRYPDLEYLHSSTYPYSDELKHKIIDDVISKGYGVQISPALVGRGILIWIDKGNFKQR